MEVAQTKFHQEMKLLQHESRIKIHTLQEDFRVTSEKAQILERKISEVEGKRQSEAVRMQQSLEDATKMIEKLQKVKIQSDEALLLLKVKYEALISLQEQQEKLNEKKLAETIQRYETKGQKELDTLKEENIHEIETLKEQSQKEVDSLKMDHENYLVYLKAKWRQQAEDKITSIKRRFQNSGVNMQDHSLVKSLTQQLKNLEFSLQNERQTFDRERQLFAREKGTLRNTIRSELQEYFTRQHYQLKEKYQSFIRRLQEDCLKEKMDLKDDYDERHRRMKSELESLKDQLEKSRKQEDYLKNRKQEDYLKNRTQEDYLFSTTGNYTYPSGSNPAVRSTGPRACPTGSSASTCQNPYSFEDIFMPTAELDTFELSLNFR